MDPYRFIITPRAGADIQSIYDYIASDAQRNAAAMVARILDALEPLKLFPLYRDLSQLAVDPQVLPHRHINFRITLPSLFQFGWQVFKHMCAHIQKIGEQ